ELVGVQIGDGEHHLTTALESAVRAAIAVVSWRLYDPSGSCPASHIRIWSYLRNSYRSGLHAFTGKGMRSPGPCTVVGGQAQADRLQPAVRHGQGNQLLRSH